MKQVLMLCPVPATAAATRFRLQQFVPYLFGRGIAATIRPFLTATELTLLYAPQKPVAMTKMACAALGRRLEDLVTASRCDLVVIQREAALVGPPVIEWALTRAVGVPLVFDFDDAIWEPYVSPTYGRWLPRLVKMPQKTNYTVRVARQVIVGNEHLAAYARRHNANVTVVPTVVDTDVFEPRVKSNPVPVIGWIGTHSTAAYLLRLAPALQRLARTHAFVLRVVGADVVLPGVPTEVRAWNLAREVADFQSLDIGLYPMVDDAWSRGKSGLKAVQYMACGVPVVASPVGSVLGIITPGHNGYLARSDDDWVRLLTNLLEDAGLRQRIGDAGRATAVCDWSLRKFAPVFADVLERGMA